jgi:PAS domain S-box-containing protein
MRTFNGLKTYSLIFVFTAVFSFLIIFLLGDATGFIAPLIFGGFAVCLNFIWAKNQQTYFNQYEKQLSAQYITKKQEVQLELAKAKLDMMAKEERLRKFTRIIEQNPTSIIITDLSGTIEYVNPRFTEVSGYEFDEIVGQKPNILKSGELSTKGYENLWDTISSGKTWRGEFHNKRKDGSLYWEYAHIAPVKNEKGTITHYIAIKEEITAKKSIDEARKMYAKALHSIGDIVVILDLESTIIYVNEAFCKIYSYKESQIIGKKFNTLLPADTPDDLIPKIFNRAYNNGWQGDVRSIDKHGRIFYINLSSSVILDDKQNPVAMVGVARDLTEEKSIQEISRRAEMLTTVQELAGSVSHEFSQPLQALTNYISLIKMGKPEEEYIDKVEKTLQRISGLVENLAEITSIQKQDYLNSKIINIKASSRNSEAEQQKKILVVDDEHQILETVIEMLKISGYQCEGAADGLEALNMVSKNSYHLIISDINMPRMNGIQLFEKLQAIGYKEAFIFLTGYSVPNEMSLIIDKVDGLLNKPVDMKTLIGVTQKILGKPLEQN